MTPEQQQIAIAKACGWRPNNEGRPWVEGQGYGIPPNGEDWYWQPVPDYLNDLDAIVAAVRETFSTIAGRPNIGDFWDNLHQIVTGDTFYDDDTTNAICFRVATATAAQWCEAFLRTLNLWTE